MFLSCWLTSVRNLFSSRRLRGGRRPVRRWRQSDAQQQLEQLEARQVMAFDFVSAAAHLGAFITEGSTQQEAPPQITLTFSPGVKVDPQSIGSGISVIRGGNGVLGDSDDILVAPGSITVDDLPNQNSVVIRFADTLPDDAYRIRITGAGAACGGRAGAGAAGEQSLKGLELDMVSFSAPCARVPARRAAAATRSR
jgi:hypothetical protein